MRWTPLLTAALLGACFNPSGMTDESGSDTVTTPGTSPGTTTADPTTSSTTAEPTTGSISTASSTTTQTATTTAAPTSSSIDETTTTEITTTGETTAVDTTITSGETASDACDPPCDTCQTCVDGIQCVWSPEQTECTPTQDTCGGKVWGLEDSACFAAVYGGGTCDARGNCIPKCAKGEMKVQCGDGCVSPMNTCKAGTDFAAVNPSNLCFTDGLAHADCGPMCLGMGALEYFHCAADGACVTGGTMDCGNYACDNGANVCRTSCSDSLECSGGHLCDAGVCI
jgi:hypothetical protein